MLYKPQCICFTYITATPLMERKVRSGGLFRFYAPLFFDTLRGSNLLLYESEDRHAIVVAGTEPTTHAFKAY
jgi:hypothetical protein